MICKIIFFSRYELGYDQWVFTSSPNQDADKACAAMAEKYNAFGILSQDTDFLIHQYSEKILFFSIKHLNVKTLDTIVYDRQKLASHLGLEMHQFPLLATLKGNDIVFFEDLKGFHQRLTGKIQKIEIICSLQVLTENCL